MDMCSTYVDGADLVVTWKRENIEPEIGFIQGIIGPTGVHRKFKCKYGLIVKVISISNYSVLLKQFILA